MHGPRVKTVALGALALVALATALAVYFFATRKPEAEPPFATTLPEHRSELPIAGSAQAQSPGPDRARLNAADSAVTEAELMRAASDALDRAPQTALDHILKADRLYGERNEARRALEIEARVRLGNIGHARSLADRFYRAFPASSQIAHIERLTGYHPRPYGPPEP